MDFIGIKSIETLLIKHAKSFTSEDIPEYFLVTFDIGHYDFENRGALIAEQLATQELSGVKGISGNILIIQDFFNVARDTLLVMNGYNLVNLNKVSRVMYDNPNYLVSNNLEVLFRIWNQNSTLGVVQNIITHMRAVLGKSDLGYWLGSSGAITHYLSKELSDNPPEIKTFNQFFDWFWNVISSMKNTEEYKNSSYTTNTVNGLLGLERQGAYDLLKSTFDHINLIYSSEGEWKVKEGSLKIPPNSTLYLTLSADDLKDEAIQMIPTNRQLVREMLETNENYIEKARLESFFGNRGLVTEIKRLLYLYDTLDGIYEIRLVNYQNYMALRNSLFDSNAASKERQEKLKEFFNLT